MKEYVLTLVKEDKENYYFSIPDELLKSIEENDYKYVKFKIP